MVMVRRDGFSNDQWLIEGLNLLDLKYRAARLFRRGPVRTSSGPTAAPTAFIARSTNRCAKCRATRSTIIWLIDIAPLRRKIVAGLTPVWRGPGSILYRVQQ